MFCNSWHEGQIVKQLTRPDIFPYEHCPNTLTRQQSRKCTQRLDNVSIERSDGFGTETQTSTPHPAPSTSHPSRAHIHLHPSTTKFNRAPAVVGARVLGGFIVPSIDWPLADITHRAHDHDGREGRYSRARPVVSDGGADSCGRGRGRRDRAPHARSVLSVRFRVRQ